MNSSIYPISDCDLRRHMTSPATLGIPLEDVSLSPSSKFRQRADTKFSGTPILRKTSNATHRGFPTPFEAHGSMKSPVAKEHEDDHASNALIMIGRETDEQSWGEKSDELRPCDGGKHAWLFLVGAAVVEGLMWGFPLTYGVFQTYYQSNPPFQDNPHLAMVGTLTTGISYLGTMLVTPFTIKYPTYQRHMIFGGWILCILSLVAGSFSNKLWHLILGQGLGYGMGFLVIYYPMLSMVNDWFIKRRGLAYGVLFGSASAFGLGLPFLVEASLWKFGYAITLRAFALGIFVLVGPTLPLLKPRTPPKMMTPSETKFHWSTLHKVTFAAISFSNIFQGLVYFLPGTFLPTYTAALGLESTHGSLVLALANLAQVFGSIATGILADKYTPYLPMTLSTLLSTFAIFLLWGFSFSLTPLLIFALIYGLLAGGYSVLYCRFVTALSVHRATGLWLYCIFECQRGAGNILGGYVAGLLVKKGVKLGSYGLGEYRHVILFVGLAMAIASTGGMGWWWRDREWAKKKWAKVRTSEEVEGALVLRPIFNV